MRSGIKLTVFPQVARNLHDCLAFASFKAQNGWQNRTLSSIEPEVTEQLKRKRPYFGDDMISDSSSNASDESLHNPPLLPSLATKPSIPNSRHSFSQDAHYAKPTKRVRSASIAGQENRSFSSMSWKQDHHLPQSSPIFHRSLPVSTQIEPAYLPDIGSNVSHTSFDTRMESGSDDHQPALHFPTMASSSIISSSPPRTPPPARGVRDGNAKQAGANLLLFFANSPSRSPTVNISRFSDAGDEPPSTPPSQHPHLPSSVMHTPGANLGLFNGALQTPCQNFNFADFVNVTPSPAQLPWGGRTPAAAKTPGPIRTARRGLNFDSLVPPSNSPTLQRKQPASRGLALQLGEELIPRP